MISIAQKDPYGSALRPYMIYIIHVLLTLMREEGGEVHIRDIHKKPSIAHRARQYDTIYKKKSRKGSGRDRIHIYVHAIPHSGRLLLSSSSFLSVAHSSLCAPFSLSPQTLVCRLFSSLICRNYSHQKKDRRPELIGGVGFAAFWSIGTIEGPNFVTISGLASLSLSLCEFCMSVCGLLSAVSVWWIRCKDHLKENWWYMCMCFGLSLYELCMSICGSLFDFSVWYILYKDDLNFW